MAVTSDSFSQTCSHGQTGYPNKVIVSWSRSSTTGSSSTISYTVTVSGGSTNARYVNGGTYVTIGGNVVYNTGNNGNTRIRMTNGDKASGTITFNHSNEYTFSIRIRMYNWYTSAAGGNRDGSKSFTLPALWQAPTQTFRTYARNNQTNNATDSGNRGYTDNTHSSGATGYVGDTFYYVWDKNDQANVGNNCDPSSYAYLARSDSNNSGLVNNHPSTGTDIHTVWNWTYGAGDLYADYTRTATTDDSGKYLLACMYKHYKDASGTACHFHQANGHYIQKIPTMSANYTLRSHRFYTGTPSLCAVTFNSVSITTNGYLIHNRVWPGGMIELHASVHASGTSCWAYLWNGTTTTDWSLSRTYQLYSTPCTVTAVNSTNSGIYTKYQSPNLASSTNTGYDLYVHHNNDIQLVSGTFDKIVASDLKLTSPVSLYPTSKETVNFVVDWKYNGTKSNVRGDYRIESSTDGVTWTTEAISGSPIYKDWSNRVYCDLDRSSTGWAIDQSGTNFVFVGVKLSTTGLYYRITLIPSSTDSEGYQIFGDPIQLITNKIYRVVLPLVPKTQYITSILPPIQGVDNKFFFKYQNTTNWGNYNDNTTFAHLRRIYYDSTHYDDFIDQSNITASAYIEGEYDKKIASNATGSVLFRTKSSVKVSDWDDTEFTSAQSNYKQIAIIAAKPYIPTATEFKITTPLATTLLTNIPFSLALPNKTINGNSLINSGNIYVDGVKSSTFNGLEYKLGDVAGWDSVFVAGNTTLGSDGTCTSITGDRTVKFDKKEWTTDTLVRGVHKIKIDAEILTYFDSDGTRKIKVPTTVNYPNLAKAVSDSTWVVGDNMDSSQLSKVTGSKNSQALPLNKKYYYKLTNLMSSQPTKNVISNKYKFKVSDTNNLVDEIKVVYTDINGVDHTITSVEDDIINPNGSNFKTNVIYGKSSYNGVPTPSDPITVKGVGVLTETINSSANTLNSGSNILHGFDFGKDEYNVITGKITKNIYEYSLTGDEDFTYYINSDGTTNDGRFHIRYDTILGLPLVDNYSNATSTHFINHNVTNDTDVWGVFNIRIDGYLIFFDSENHFNGDVEEFKTFLKEQASNDTPVKIYYQVATAETITVAAKNITTVNNNVDLVTSSLSLNDSTKNYLLYGHYKSVDSTGNFYLNSNTNNVVSTIQINNTEGDFKTYLSSPSAVSSLYVSVDLDSTNKVTLSNLVLVELNESLDKSGSDYVDYNGNVISESDIIGQGFFTGTKITIFLKGYSVWKNNSLMSSITNGKKYFIVFEAKTNQVQTIELKRGSLTVASVTLDGDNIWHDYFFEWTATGSGNTWSFYGDNVSKEVYVDGLFIMNYDAFKTAVNDKVSSAVMQGSVPSIEIPTYDDFQEFYEYNISSGTYNTNVDHNYQLPVNHVLLGTTKVITSNELSVEIGEVPLSPVFNIPNPAFFYAGAERNLTWTFSPQDWGVTDTTYNNRHYVYELYKVNTSGGTDTKITNGTIASNKTSYTYTFTPLNSNIGTYRLKLKQKNVLGESDWVECDIEILKAIEPGLSEITTSEIIALDNWGWDLGIKPGDNGSYVPVKTAPITRMKVDLIQFPTNLYNSDFRMFDNNFISSISDGWYKIQATNSGTNIDYIDFWSNQNLYLKPDTEYSYVLEIRNVDIDSDKEFLIGNTASDINFPCTQFTNSETVHLTKGMADAVVVLPMKTRADVRHVGMYCGRDLIPLEVGARVNLEFRVSLIEGSVNANIFEYTPYKDPLVKSLISWTNYNNLQDINRHFVDNLSDYVDGTYYMFIQYERYYTTQTTREIGIFQIVPPEVMLYNRSHPISYDENTDKVKYQVHLESFAATTSSEAWYSLDYGDTWIPINLTSKDGAIRIYKVQIEVSWLDEIYFKMHGVNPVDDSIDTWVDEISTDYKVWLSWADKTNSDIHTHNRLVPTLTFNSYSANPFPSNDRGEIDTRLERYMYTASKTSTTYNRGFYFQNIPNSVGMVDGKTYRIEFKARCSRARTQNVRVEFSYPTSTKNIDLGLDYKLFYIDFVYSSSTTYKGLSFYSTNWLPEEKVYVKEFKVRQRDVVKDEDFVRRLFVSHNGSTAKKVRHISKH